MALNKEEWVQNTVMLLNNEALGLSVSDLETAVNDHLALLGGWVPDNPAVPDGAGEPASGDTPQEAYEQILKSFRESTVEVAGTFTITISPRYMIRVDPNSPTAEASVTADIESQLSSILGPTPFSVVSSSIDPAYQLNSTGSVDASKRQAVEAAIAGSDVKSPIEYAVKTTRDLFLLTNLWNARTVSITSDDTVLAEVVEYADTTYMTEKEGSTVYRATVSRNNNLLNISIVK